MTGETAAPIDELGRLGEEGIDSRPAKVGSLAVALAFTAGTLFVGAQPGYASKPHLAAAVGDISEYTIPTTTPGAPYFIAAGPDGNLWFTESGRTNRVTKVTTSGAVTAYRAPSSCNALGGIAAGPDGNLWFTCATGNTVAKVTTAGVFTAYTISTVGSSRTGIAAGPDGNLWFTEDSGNKVAKVTTLGVFTEYTLPTASSSPYAIAAGPDGDLWFTEFGGNKVAKVTTSGVFTEYTVPTANSNPLGIAPGPDGNLWFTEKGGNKVGSVTTSGVFTEYPLPTANAYPNGIAAGPDGNLWFTEAGGNKVAKVTTSGIFTEYPVPTNGAVAVGPDGNLWFSESGAVAKVTTSGVVTEYPVRTGSSGPAGIAAGPDGDLWFTESTPSANKVAKVTTSGAFTEYSVPTPNFGAGAIAAGPDGNLWFMEGGPGSNKLGRVTTSGSVAEYPVPTDGGSAITTGPDGNLWFTDLNTNKVTKVTTSGAFTQYTVPTTNSYPYGIAAGPDGNLWFTEYNTNKVAKVTTSGVFTEYPIPTGNGPAYGIAAGPDGNLWFIDGNTVAKVTTSGVFTEYTIPTANSNAYGIAAGPDGNLWFTESTVNQVARVTTSGVITEFSVPTANSFPYGIAAGPDGNLWFTELEGNKVAMVVASVGPSCPAAAATPATVRASSTRQYTLANSDGAAWQEIDAAKLQVTCMPTANQSVLLTANADLWTANAGYNQDIGIFVSDNGGADQLLAWKESGGFAGTFSPNAAYVQTLYNMTNGHSYVFKLKWKTNKPATGATIFAAAGAGPIYSPTSLVAETFPTGVVPNFAVSTSQYTLPSSDGATWQAIDAANLSTTLAPPSDATAVLGGNADLWTANPGYNQDLGIFVSDNTGPDTLVGWKESGGFAGTYSPNAAFVKATYPMTAGHSYTFTLKWKTNKNAAGATIFAAAGGPAYSQTSLLAEAVGSLAVASKTVTYQYNLPSSNGVDWQPIDAANLTSTTGTISADINALVGGNADLWTAYAGVNQDLGIFVSDNGGPDVLVAWKESGGFAGTYSPNAAFVQAVYPMTSGHTYAFTLKWKSNINNPYARIYVGAGGPGVFSPTRLTIELTN